MENKYRCLAMNDEYAKRLCYHEDKHTIRTEFERDRDRILYSRAFRRLSGKTQVFLAGNDDHARTRLTHTLEVAQISRTIAKSLGLNEDLTEAIALGHDIGHTPFGHVGERMLNNIMNGCYIIRDFNSTNETLSNCKGFKHNWQAIRVATDLEYSTNLTDYTLWGILNHSDINYSKCKMKDKNNSCLFRHESNKKCTINLEDDNSLSFYTNMKVKDSYVYEKIKDKWSFEGLIVGLADEIAQRHHDIEDALEYSIILKDELYKELDLIFNYDDYTKKLQQENKQNKIQNLQDFSESIKEHKKNFADIYKSINEDDIDLYKSKFSKFIVNLLTTDAILNIKNNFHGLVTKYNIKNRDDFYNNRAKIEDFESIITYSSFIKENDKQLKKFLSDRILNSHMAQTMDGVGQHVIKELFKAYLINPQQLPDKTIVKLFKNLYKENEKGLDIYKYKNSNRYNIGELRNVLSKYHYNAETSDTNNTDANNTKKIRIDYDIYKIQLLRTICDYIAGMTDKYTIEQHRKLYNII